MHCSGALKAASGWARVEPGSVRVHSRARAAAVDALYDGLDSVGLQYGPGYRTLVHVWGGAGSALSRLRARATQEGTQVHPADLDDALCTSAAINAGSGIVGAGETRLPFAVDDAQLRGAPGALWAVRDVARTLASSALLLSLCFACACVCCAGRVSGERGRCVGAAWCCQPLGSSAVGWLQVACVAIACDAVGITSSVRDRVARIRRGGGFCRRNPCHRC